MADAIGLSLTGFKGKTIPIRISKVSYYHYCTRTDRPTLTLVTVSCAFCEGHVFMHDVT